ncbi:hypothetical protein OESDEN_20327, partial [Oesophagostomum dentatum]
LFQRGQCICTSAVPRAQPQLKQFIEEQSVDVANKISYDGPMQRDVSTPESGVDAGEEPEEQQMDASEDESREELDETSRKVIFLNFVVNSLDKKEMTVQMVVIAPHRELLQQICKGMHNSVRKAGISLYTSVRQTSIRDDEFILKNGMQVPLATSQRNCELIKRGILTAERVKVIALDKPEELFCAGSRVDMLKIIDALPDNIQPCGGIFAEQNS